MKANAMRYRMLLSLIVGFVMAASVASGAARTGLPPGTPRVGGRTLKHVATIDLPGPAGRRFDYLTIDDEGRYLFSVHLAAGLLYVIDLRRNTVVTAIPDVPGVEGLAYIGEGHNVYTSNWYENKIGVVDLDGLALGQLTPGPVVISTCHPELAAAGGGSAFRFGRNIRTGEDSK